MYYRVRVDFAFTTQGPAIGLYHHALGILPQAETINPETDRAEHSYCRRDDCYHDEDPPATCSVVEYEETP